MFIKKISRVLKTIEPFKKAWAKETQKALDGQLPLWVVLGDSMSQSIGASEFRKGWVGQALDMLHRQNKNYAVVNLSKSGAKINDVLYTQLPTMKTLDIRPAIVTVLVGSNDLISPKYRKQLPSNLEKLLNHLPEGTIVGNIFHRPNTSPVFKSVFSHNIASDLLLRIANKRKLTVISLDKAFGPPWRGKLASDFFHPNDYGYEGIARAFADAMQKTK